MSSWWIIGFLLAERLFELGLAGRNGRILVERGGREHFRDSYRSVVALHLLFLAALIAEAHPWRIPLDGLTLLCLTGLLLTMALRYWCVATLGPFWNTRIIVLPGAKAIRRGPYRFLRHPNYLVVTLEFALIPLLLRAPFTLLIFSLANVAVLRQRIGLEERAMKTAHQTTPS